LLRAFIPKAVRAPRKTRLYGCNGSLASYELRSLGHLAAEREADGVLIGRCGLTELVVETATPERGLRKGWFGRERVTAGLGLTYECELGFTFDPAFWSQGFATEAACCVRDYARDVLRLSYAVSAILPHNARSRRVAERLGAQVEGQMDVDGRRFDRYVWPLATGDEIRLQPAARL
jgi:RimJ/RimL family protein N-acetyltransferase